MHQKLNFSNQQHNHTLNWKGHIHVTLLDIFIGVLVHAILLAALPVEPEEPAHRHPRLVVLVQEPARLALHAQAAEPVPAHRLPEAPPSGNVPAARVVRSGGD